MKFMLALLFVTLSAFAEQKNFSLIILKQPDDTYKVTYNSTDWLFVADTPTYNVFVEKNALSTNEDTVDFHSITYFKEPQRFDGLYEPVDKIYSYGIMDCNNSLLYIISELYVNVDQTVIFSDNFDPGSRMINMNDPGTIRYDILQPVCNKLI